MLAKRRRGIAILWAREDFDNSPISLMNYYTIADDVVYGEAMALIRNGNGKTQVMRSARRGVCTGMGRNVEEFSSGSTED